MKNLKKISLIDMQKSFALLDLKAEKNLMGGDLPDIDHPYCPGEVTIYGGYPEIELGQDLYGAYLWSTNNWDNSEYTNSYNNYYNDIYGSQWTCTCGSTSCYCEPYIPQDYAGGGGSYYSYSEFTSWVGYNGAIVYGTYGTPELSVAFAQTFEGVEENSTPVQDNSTILTFLSTAGITGDQLVDETGWCAAFITYVLEFTGRESTGAACVDDHPEWGLTGYRSWGQETTTPQAGDLYIAGGHVGMVVSVDGNNITVISGNSNSDGSAGKVHTWTTTLNNSYFEEFRTDRTNP